MEQSPAPSALPSQPTLGMAQAMAASKRPRLSLQIKATTSAPGTRVSRSLAIVDPKSPTAFNTLSNVYVTAIERSTPINTEPLTAINTLQQPQVQPSIETKDSMQRIHTPYAPAYPETPLTAHPNSPMTMEITYPSVMTATPPLSAGPIEANAPAVFTFAKEDSTRLTINTAVAPVLTGPRTPRRRATLAATPNRAQAPYTHPRSLHSILRNSPLPPTSANVPSPRRQSARLQEKAARRVAYNSPLTQTITTQKYTKSHIDLLCEEASPSTPGVLNESDTVLDLALAFTGDETRDGGQTPGPFEEMRRRMASLGTTTPISPSGPGGIRKRKRKEKKRRWVWTIGQEEDDEDVGGAMAAIRAAQVAQVSTPAVLNGGDQTPLARPREVPSFEELPTPSIETVAPEMELMDVDMSETASCLSMDRAITPVDMDLDLMTPIAVMKEPPVVMNDRLGSVDLINPETGMRRDTPVPPDMMAMAAA